MGLIGQIVRLANTLAEADTPRTRSGRIDGDGGRINYTVTFDSIGPGRTHSRQENRDRRRKQYLTDVREVDGELILTIDLPDVSEDDLSVRFDDETGTVEIRDVQRYIKRLSLPGEKTEITSASFNNHVLELRFGETPDG
ncbi:Hsp20/alpha crystallin family protein [Haladaptatus sp. NG-WS-4]